MRLIDRPDDATELLVGAREGDRRAADEFTPLVYDQLRALAQHLLAQERRGHSLEATALVHEAYLKLVDQTRATWRDELHFFAVAATAIRRILVDHARGRLRQKRGGASNRLTLETDLLDPSRPEHDLVELDDLLRALEIDDPRSGRIVELRFFGGLTIDQAAEFLEVSTATIERDWRYARAWLFERLYGTGYPEGGSPS
ncbi:MAG: sigma-70 family RNA polymerase sigma factor [Planctomycetota bacterium]|jgi:RNA polymerase sigma factor (TIGR02999 family)